MLLRNHVRRSFSRIIQIYIMVKEMHIICIALAESALVDDARPQPAFLPMRIPNYIRNTLSN
jgi:hypothetical protein